jgi:hypothetical protein
VQGGSVVSVSDGSMFLGLRSLFKNNVGTDLSANNAHIRINNTLFTGAPPPLAGRVAGVLYNPVAQTAHFFASPSSPSCF